MSYNIESIQGSSRENIPYKQSRWQMLRYTPTTFGNKPNYGVQQDNYQYGT